MDEEQTPDERVHVVRTGLPMTYLIACKKCGVLLWDVDAHYQHTHPATKEGA